MLNNLEYITAYSKFWLKFTKRLLSLTDNHEQHSNSSSHSHTTPHIAAAVGAIAAVAGNVTNNIATSTPIVLPVTKKTDHDQIANKTADAAGIDSATEHIDDQQQEQATPIAVRKDGKRMVNTGDGNETHSELMIEPKNEYDDDEDDEGNEPVEDLTLDDEDMLDDMDQAGPSHGGEGSSSGNFLFKPSLVYKKLTSNVLQDTVIGKWNDHKMKDLWEDRMEDNPETHKVGPNISLLKRQHKLRGDNCTLLEPFS